MQRIFVKSVGWGWLGYHAYIAGTRLAGFVPPVIELRNGLLFTEWLEEAKQSQETSVNDNLLHTLSSYVAQRAQRLRLIEDPCFTNSDDGTGWAELINTFRGAYGPYINRLKVPALRRRLRRYVSPLPTLVDGQMKSDEWIETKTGPYKVDFEHHNFGGEELNVVDPAYDLASAIFEFRLSEPAEQKLLQGYVRESGDRTISDRILLYKLLYGIRAMKRAANRVVRKSSNQKQEQWNRRYLLARDFLIAQTNRLCSSLIMKQERARWTKSLFFLDLDGVFDCEIFGFLNFPHTTSSGLAALALLQSHGFSIILNTGGSVEHVRNYCQTYALPGGLAEYGSVFVDAVQQRELALIEAEAAEQLVRCREAIIKIPGVFTDPGYQYSVRAYRYNGQRTAGLGVAEVENLLTRLQCDRLTFIVRSEDTYIVQKGTGKGPGLLVAKRYLGCTNEPVIAMGDSEQDLTMLEEAEFSYAPANCSKRIRELANKSRCRIMAQPFQRGLLAAVLDVLGNGPTAYHGNTIKLDHAKDSSDLLPLLLQVAERSRLRQFLAVLNWRGL